jgi:acyl CoA:acetate/3-ketoacid CoA transferase beta subunit
VIAPGPDGLMLLELAPGVSIKDVCAVTAAQLRVDRAPQEMRLGADR